MLLLTTSKPSKPSKPIESKNTMNHTFVKNDFHGYNKEIRHKGDYPAASTIQAHIRASKPEGCKSVTTFRQIELDQTLFLYPGRDGVEVVGI